MIRDEGGTTMMTTTTIRAAMVGSALLAAASLPAQAQDMKTVSQSRALAGEETLDVQIVYGAGVLSVGPAEGGVLYALDLRYDERQFEPMTRFSENRLEVGVEGRGRNIDLDDDDDGQLDLKLAPGLPMDLRLEFGAGRATVDLGGLALRDLDIETGASESRIRVSRPNPQVLRRAEFNVGAADFEATRLANLNLEELSVNAGVGRVALDFSGTLRRDLEVDVDMGLGSLELRVPEGVGVRIEKSSFLTSFDADGFIRRDGVYYSADWDSATRRIMVDVTAAFGSISVERSR